MLGVNTRFVAVVIDFSVELKYDKESLVLERVSNTVGMSIPIMVGIKSESTPLRVPIVHTEIVATTRDGVFNPRDRDRAKTQRSKSSRFCDGSVSGRESHAHISKCQSR